MASMTTPGSTKALRYCQGLLPLEDATTNEEYFISEANIPHWKHRQEHSNRSMESHIAEIEEIAINPTKYQDPVFIDIDTEGDPAREFGISILDTRDLKHILLTSTSERELGFSFQPSITNYNDTKEPNSRAPSSSKLLA
jgi:hypothetical protein